jgi:hypothetical protein
VFYSAATCQSTNQFQPEELIWSALGSALFVIIVMPNSPVTQSFLNRLRFLTHELALFPFALHSLVSALSISPFSEWKGSDTALAEELGRYGVTSKWLSTLSQSTRQSLLEVFSLRRHLTDNVFSPKDLGGPQSTEDAGLANKGTLQKFAQAHRATFDRLETNFRRLVRRTALALLLAGEIGEKVADDTLGRAISDFVAEECDDTLARCRSLVAAAALSCVPHRADRTLFLKLFGYEAPSSPSLPLLPWIIVFVLDFALFLVPSFLMWFTGENQVDATRFAAFAFVHAISQSVAITWAIYPKVVSNFARPSLYSLPWQSYLLCGLGSYITGAIILFIFRLYIPFEYPIIVPTLLSSVSFFLMAVGLSVLIDRRLLSRSLNFDQGRLREGASLAVFMLLGPLIFQRVMFGPGLGWIPPTGLGSLIPISFLLFSALLGFLTGYLVPSTAAAYLQRTRLQAPDPAWRAAAADRRSATWEAASSTQTSLKA